MKATSIYEVIRPIHLCSQIIGLTSFSIKRDSNRNYEGFISIYNWFCIITFTFWHAANIFRLNLDELIWEINDRDFMSKWFEDSMKILITINCLVWIFTVWWFLAMKSKLTVVINWIEEVDKALSSLNIPVNHGRHRKLLIIFLTVAQALNVCSTLFSFAVANLTKVYEPDIYSDIAQFIAFELIILLFSQIISFMWTVCIRSQQINSFLNSVYMAKLSSIEKFPVQESEALKILPIIHDKLVDIAERLSFCYGVPVRLIESLNSVNFRSLIDI